MRNLKRLIFCAVSAMPISTFADLILPLGTAVNDETLPRLAQESIPYAASRCGWAAKCPAHNPEVRAFVNLGGEFTYYSLKSDDKIYRVDISRMEFLGGWPLGIPNPCGTNKDCAAPWWVGRWGADEVLEKEVIERYRHGDLSWDATLETDNTIMGCMQQSPLRYGDLEEDGKKELAVLHPNGYSVDFIIFSTELKKTVFAAKLDYNNVISHADQIGDKILSKYLPSNPAQHYQYWSRSGSDQERIGAMAQGYRGFAKLYPGEFSGAGNRDLLVWRKLYNSRLLSDPVKGFQKISDTFVHYKQIAGEYKKQPTDSATVKSWLTTKQLTWQKGYPSKSECKGQEGQLIPEMHDPLLNDPDVLK